MKRLKNRRESRFLLQLMVEYPHPITKLTLQGYMGHQQRGPQPVPNTFLQSLSTSPSTPYLLSPSAINRYLRCPLMFHYYYVCGLRELDDGREEVHRGAVDEQPTNLVN